MTDMLIFNCTTGGEQAERATLPFVAANIAAVAGQESVVLCTIDAVRLGTAAGVAGVAADGFPVLADLVRDFVANGGRIWLCGACTKPRGIGDDDLADGVTIVGAARVVEEIVNGARSVAFA
jgi:predicted peroxiredoxin